MKRSTPAVHPHARGDNNLTVIGTPGWVGSPPRAWGQHRAWPLERCPGRFTPTRVGTTPTKLLILRDAHEEKALEVIDAPSRTAPSADFKALLIITGVEDEATTSFGLAASFLPEPIADQGRDAADKHAGLRFQKPAGELAAQSGRDAFKNQDHHRRTPFRQLPVPTCARPRRLPRHRPKGSLGRRHPDRNRCRKVQLGSSSAPPGCRG